MIRIYGLREWIKCIVGEVYIDSQRAFCHVAFSIAFTCSCRKPALCCVFSSHLPQDDWKDILRNSNEVSEPWLRLKDTQYKSFECFSSK